MNRKLALAYVGILVCSVASGPIHGPRTRSLPSTQYIPTQS